MWASGRELVLRVPNLTTFGEDEAGEIYVGTSGGAFARLREIGVTPAPTSTATPPVPTATSTPTPTAAPTPIPADRAPVLPPTGIRRPTPRLR
jgi:hypothetical protein